MMHIHWHKFIARKGVNLYYECRCGRRRVKEFRGFGFSPIDHQWLNGSDWTKEPTIGPEVTVYR